MVERTAGRHPIAQFHFVPAVVDHIDGGLLPESQDTPRVRIVGEHPAALETNRGDVRRDARLGGSLRATEPRRVVTQHNRFGQFCETVLRVRAETDGLDGATLGLVDEEFVVVQGFQVHEPG